MQGGEVLAWPQWICEEERVTRAKHGLELSDDVTRKSIKELLSSIYRTAVIVIRSSIKPPIRETFLFGNYRQKRSTALQG